MQITPQQEALVRAWAAEGATLSDIQTRLADECGLRLSYLDTRFLLLDLKVDLVEKTKKEPPPPAAIPAAAAPGGSDVPPGFSARTVEGGQNACPAGPRPPP